MKKIWLAIGLLLLGAMAAAQTNSAPIKLDTAAGPVLITPIAHATVKLEAGGKTIWIDPAPPAKVAGMTPGDLILITDIHPDHLNADNLKTLSKAGTVIYGPPAVVKEYPAAKPIEVGKGTKWGGWKIDSIPAYNITPTRGPEPGKLFHPKGRGVGYVLTYGGKRIYFSGDTEAVPEMKSLKKIDLAFVCMNLPYTMTPEEAVEGIKAFHPKMVVPYHYRGQDPTKVAKLLAGTGIEVKILDLYPR